MEQISNLLDLVVSTNSGGRRGAKAVDADGLDTWREALGAARQAFRDADRAQSSEDIPDAERPVPVGFHQEGGPLEASLEVPTRTGGPSIGPPLILVDAEALALEVATAEPVPVETVPTARLPLSLVASVEAPEAPTEPKDVRAPEPQPAVTVELGSRDAQLDGVTVRTDATVTAEPSRSSTRAASPAPTPVPAPPQGQPAPQVESQPQVQPAPQVESPPQVQPAPQVESPPQVQAPPKIETPPNIEAQPAPQVESQPQVQPAPTVARDVAAEPVPPVATDAPNATATTSNPVEVVAPPAPGDTDSVPRPTSAPESTSPAAKPVDTPSSDVTVEIPDVAVAEKPAASTETPTRTEPQVTEGVRSVVSGAEPVQEEPRVVVDDEVPEAIIDDSEPVNVEVRQPADPIDAEAPAETPAIAAVVDVQTRTVERRSDAGVARRSAGRASRVDSTAASSEPIHVDRPEVDDRPRMMPHNSGVATDGIEIKPPIADDAPEPVDPEMTSSKQPAPPQNAAPELARAAVREYASAPAASDSAPAPAPAPEPTAPVSDSTVGGMQADALDGAKPQQAAARVHHQALATAIAAKARAVPQDGSVELRFALEPEDLGAVRVRIESRGDQLKIKIIASSGAAVDSLSSGIGKLASQLTEPGMKEPEIDLTFSDSAEHPEHSDRDGKGGTAQGGSPISGSSGDLAPTGPSTLLDNNSGSTTQLDRMA